ncbi:MAG TPA: hypothetical protein VK550_20865 [Polyangiaceae bacterium]|nr:hypothetical protein [Polyangiaceae bacterium]
MVHARIFAAVLSLSTSAAVLLAGPTLTDEGQARAAARPSAKPTAARTTRARRSNDPPSAARRTNDATHDGSSTAIKDVPTREGDAQSERTSAPRTGEKVAAKNAPESASNTKSATADTRASSAPEVMKPAPDGTSGRSIDARPSAAKTPTDKLSNTKATTDKLGNETASVEVPDARSSLETVSPTGRRELVLAAGAAPTPRSVVVALEGPVFDGGDVPRAAAALERMKGAFTRCASVENALTKAEASIDLRFLVRAPGRAEGVDVDKARGVSADVVRCMTAVLARSYVGAPSDDPVGVAVTVRVKRPEPTNN